MTSILRQLALAFLLATIGATARAADYDSAIAQARDNVQKSQYTPALAAARRARAMNPKDFRSYYYEAMSLLGLNRRAEAQQAVQAARERAPASAKAALDKLADMVTDNPPQVAKEVAPASGAVFVSCTYVTTRDGESGRENTQVFRLERGNFREWTGSEWSANQCIFSNYITDSKSEGISHKCEMDETRFLLASTYTFKETLRITENWSTSRMTGNYSGGQVMRGEVITSEKFASGACRAVPDPSAGQVQKF